MRVRFHALRSWRRGGSIRHETAFGTRRPKVVARFRDVGQVAVANLVVIRGVKAESVEAVELEPGGWVHVRLSLDSFETTHEDLESGLGLRPNPSSDSQIRQSQPGTTHRPARRATVALKSAIAACITPDVPA